MKNFLVTLLGLTALATIGLVVFGALCGNDDSENDSAEFDLP
jgi:hypothetical protein